MLSDAVDTASGEPAVDLANQGIGELVDCLSDPFDAPRHAAALEQLAVVLQQGPAYIEEANRLHVVHILTRLLAKAGDDDAMDAISRIIALCSGPMACRGKVALYSYGGVDLQIKEGALGDGLGAKVWAVAHVMCSELAQHPSLVADCEILELGSGTGLVGILAAKLGAAQVYLTDNEPSVLRNLRHCMHANGGGGGSGSGTQQASGGIRPLQQQAASAATATNDDRHVDDAQPAAADCADAPSGGAAPTPAAAFTQWDAANMAVRFLEWDDCRACLDAPASSASAAGVPAAAGCCPCDESTREHGVGSDPTDVPPALPTHLRFPVVLGNEVMYEPEHAVLVAAALAHHLAPHGRALVCCAVRQRRVFAAFGAACTQRRLRCRARQVAAPPSGALGGLLSHRAGDYEGGFIIMAVDHAAAWAPWHRSDFEPM